MDMVAAPIKEEGIREKKTVMVLLNEIKMVVKPILKEMVKLLLLLKIKQQSPIMTKVRVKDEVEPNNVALYLSST